MNEQEELVKRIVEWAKTPEARRAVKKAAEDAKRFSEEYQRAMELGWRELHRPVTI